MFLSDISSLHHIYMDCEKNAIRSLHLSCGSPPDVMRCRITTMRCICRKYKRARDTSSARCRSNLEIKVKKKEHFNDCAAQVPGGKKNLPLCGGEGGESYLLAWSGTVPFPSSGHQITVRRSFADSPSCYLPNYWSTNLLNFDKKFFFLIWSIT